MLTRWQKDIRIFVGITDPHAIEFFSDNVLLKTGIIGFEKVCRHPFFDMQITNLSARAFQSLFQSFLISNFEMGNLEIASEDGCCRSHERLVRGAVLEFMMRVNIVPDDDDTKETRMGWHQSCVDSFESFRSLKSEIMVLREYSFVMTFSGCFQAVSIASFVRPFLY